MGKWRDIHFFSEYATFSSFGPVAIAAALHNGFQTACRDKDFDRAAHLICALHSEFVRYYETTGAIMLAVSKGVSKGEGIHERLLKIHQGEVKMFLTKLREEQDWLAFTGFPPANRLQGFFGDDPGAPTLTPPGFREAMEPFLTMYLREGVAEAYNKIKHGYHVIRGEFALSDNPGGSSKAQGDSVQIVLDQNKSVCIPVSTSEAKQLADTYLQNIETNYLRVRMLTEMIVYCLKEGLPLGSMAKKSGSP